MQEQDQFFEAGAMCLPHSTFQQYTFDLIDWLCWFCLPKDRKVELIPYILTSPSNHLFVNSIHHDGYNVTSTTMPASINWDVPDKFKNKSVAELLKTAISGFVQDLETD